jgi:hypothetical protein
MSVMSTKSEGFYANVTLVDVQLASAYYPILVELAKHKRATTYGELVERAKGNYPTHPAVQNAIAVSTGRRLDVVRMFTSERDFPDLTSLVVNKDTGECGVGFTRSFDPVIARERVFAFDWSSVTTDFDGFVKSAETAVKPRKRVKEATARELMASYYKEHKASLAPSVRDLRELIVELIVEGFSAEEAFARAVGGDA